MIIQNSLERFIPSAQARELLENHEYNYLDADIAAIIWHSSLPLLEKHNELYEIAKETFDKRLKRQIDERIEYDLKCIDMFKTESDGYVYVVENHEFEDDSTCLGFFGDYSLAENAGIKAGYDFFIKKQQVISVGKKNKKHRSVSAEWFLKDGEGILREYDDWPEGPIAEFEYTAMGDIVSYWSDELPIDELVRTVESLSNKRFENKYVVMPNPFEAGDIVRNIYNGMEMVVVTSQKEWSKFVMKAKQPGAIDDWSDASITVVYNEPEIESHDHINPIWLELVSARDGKVYDILSILDVGENSAIVVSAPEEIFYGVKKFKDELGIVHEIVSIPFCCGPNVDRNKSSLLIKGKIKANKMILY